VTALKRLPALRAPIRPVRGALLLAVLASLALPGVAAAQVGGDVPGPRYRVILLTIDRGDQVYEMFGHNALLIEDAVTGQSLAWNWGLFNFEDVDFIPRFLRGTMRYSMGPAEPEPFLRSYEAANRRVYAHEIHLTETQAAALDAFVRWNFQPENRPYVYDYYRDNCSTRLRDALDRVLGGELRARFEGVSTGRSYRWYSRHLVQVTGWVDQGLSFLLGMRGDPPVSAWEAMFLPVELMEYLETVEIAGDDGRPRPLLGPRQVWVEATRPPLPEGPPGPSLLLALGALAVGAVVIGLGRRAGPPPLPAPLGVRVALGAVALAWGAFSGALGLLLVAAWFTDHHFIQANLNLLYLSPLAPVAALLMAVSLASPLRARGGWGQGAFLVAASIAGLSLATALLQLAGALDQRNADVVMVGLTLNVAVAVAAWRVWGGASTLGRLGAGSRTAAEPPNPPRAGAERPR
jgi:hypothetical protein